MTPSLADVSTISVSNDAGRTEFCLSYGELPDNPEFFEPDPISNQITPENSEFRKQGTMLSDRNVNVGKLGNSFEKLGEKDKKIYQSLTNKINSGIQFGKLGRQKSNFFEKRGSEGFKFVNGKMVKLRNSLSMNNQSIVDYSNLKENKGVGELSRQKTDRLRSIMARDPDCDRKLNFVENQHVIKVILILFFLI